MKKTEQVVTNKQVCIVCDICKAESDHPEGWNHRNHRYTIDGYVKSRYSIIDLCFNCYKKCMLVIGIDVGEEWEGD